MTKILLHRHAFDRQPAERHEAESIGQWLLDHYGERPLVQVHVYGGEPSVETDLTGDVEALLLNDRELYTVLEAPGIPAAYGIWAILGNMAISMAVNYVVNDLFAPDKPTLANRTQESPNNALQSRENRVRLMERVEDIYGTVRSIPSLLMPTYFKYIEHRRVEYGYYCIGRGFHDVSDIRDGDTPLEEINGASAVVYPPFNTPNSGLSQLTVGDPIIDKILSVTPSTGVDGVGIVLKAPNQIQLEPGAQYVFRGPGPVAGFGLETLPATTQDIIYQPVNRVDTAGHTVNGGWRHPNFAAVVEAGQNITIAAGTVAPKQRIFAASVNGPAKTYTSTPPGGFTSTADGTSVTITGFPDPLNDGVKTVVSHTADTITVAEACGASESASPVTFDLLLDVAGVRAVDAVGPGYVLLAGPSQYDSAGMAVNGTITAANGLSEWTDWFTLPDTDRTEVWTNVVARGGMYRDDGAKSSTSVSYEVQIERLNPDLTPAGIVESIVGGISGATSNERAETMERVTAVPGPVRVRVRRLTPFDYLFEGAVIDEIQWVDLYSVSPVTKPHFGNKTTIHTVTHATPGATSVQRRELNCLASRLLPTYDGTTLSATFNSEGGISSGTLHPTSRIVDIIAAVTLDPKIGGRAIDEIDLPQIYAVQLQLDAWHSEAGQFNYTFDSDAVSYEETIGAIANAAFCRPYRQNGQVRLALDRPQANNVALFTHRNKKPRAETITRRFASDADYDGVELVYADPDTESHETIRLPLDGSATKPKKIEVSGIRSFAQAWFRANREYQRLRFERLAIETTVTTDARALLPNSRIEIVDNTRFRSWDGEVVAQSGLELTLSRDVEFVPAVPHSIVLKKRDGSPQSVAVTAGGAANRVVMAGVPAEAIVTEQTPEDGVRTEFSFAADSARGAQAWLVQEIRPTEDPGYYTVAAVNYSDQFYAADALAVPDKNSVIN